MKRTILTLGFVAVLGLSTVSCSTDDSAINNTTQNDLSNTDGNGSGDADLPRPLPPKL